jgi:hypothetical protein
MAAKRLESSSCMEDLCHASTAHPARMQQEQSQPHGCKLQGWHSYCEDACFLTFQMHKSTAHGFWVLCLPATTSCVLFWCLMSCMVAGWLAACRLELLSRAGVPPRWQMVEPDALPGQG